jgi:hypothetical protein
MLFIPLSVRSDGDAGRIGSPWELDLEIRVRHARRCVSFAVRALEEDVPVGMRDSDALFDRSLDQVDSGNPQRSSGRVRVEGHGGG